MISPKFTAGVPTEEEYLFVGGRTHGQRITIPVWHWMVDTVPFYQPGLGVVKESYRKHIYWTEPEIGPPACFAFFALETMDDAQALDALKKVGP